MRVAEKLRSMPTREEVRFELERICDENGGMLDPEKVVETAKSKASVLHQCFVWDDKAAGHQYRVWQARQLIRIHVTISAPTTRPVKVFVSLEKDRKGENKGYRRTTDVMASEELRMILLAQAKKEMDVFKQKYACLTALAKVFEAMDSVK